MPPLCAGLKCRDGRIRGKQVASMEVHHRRDEQATLHERARGVWGWEHRQLVVPLRISVRHWRHPDYVGAAAKRAQPIIDASLRDAVSEGWRADEPTDFASLFSGSRVRTRDTLLQWRVDSATMQLLRAIPCRRDLVPHG
jgi:hypothetical protein